MSEKRLKLIKALNKQGVTTYIDVPSKKLLKFINSIKRTQKFNNYLAYADSGINYLKFRLARAGYPTQPTNDFNFKVLPFKPLNQPGKAHPMPPVLSAERGREWAVEKIKLAHPELNMSLLSRFIKIRNINLFSKLYKKNIFGLPITTKEYYQLRFFNLIKSNSKAHGALNYYNLGFRFSLRNRKKQQVKPHAVLTLPKSEGQTVRPASQTKGWHTHGALIKDGGGEAADQKNKVKEIKNAGAASAALMGEGEGGEILTSEYKSYLHNTNKNLFFKEYFQWGRRLAMFRANIRNKLIKALVENFRKEYNEFNPIFQEASHGVRNPDTGAYARVHKVQGVGPALNFFFAGGAGVATQANATQKPSNLIHASATSPYKFFLTHFYKNKPLTVIENNIF